MDTPAQDWAEGYVVDVEYVHNFHPGLAPGNLALAALLSGVRPPDVAAPFAYLDLGCGSGFSAALFAAANPHADVWGNDFNPAHVRIARDTVKAAGLNNARFVEASFADLPDAGMPQFDIVVAHGIWSWVSSANRDRIVAFLGAAVKPGGLVMLSYNCHPGWDALMPLRRLLHDAGGREGTPIARIERGLATARALRDAGADYFRDVPAAAAALKAMEQADRAYLAHEYLNDQWTLFHPGEVAAAVAPAALRYVGQARIIDNSDPLWLDEAQRALLDHQPDLAAREAVRDLILNRTFRHDLFVREVGGGGIDQEAQDAWFAQARFALVKPRAACSLTLETRGGETTLPAEPATTILDTLAGAPATGAALAARTGASARTMREVLGVLAAMGMIQPALPATGEAERRAATDRFNAAALAAARMADAPAALASPVTGSGVGVSNGDQLLLDAYSMGIPLDAMSADDGTGEGDPVARFREAVLPKLELLGIA